MHVRWRTPNRPYSIRHIQDHAATIQQVLTGFPFRYKSFLGCHATYINLLRPLLVSFAITYPSVNSLKGIVVRQPKIESLRRPADCLSIVRNYKMADWQTDLQLEQHIKAPVYFQLQEIKIKQ